MELALVRGGFSPDLLLLIHSNPTYLVLNKLPHWNSAFPHWQIPVYTGDKFVIYKPTRIKVSTDDDETFSYCSADFVWSAQSLRPRQPFNEHSIRTQTKPTSEIWKRKSFKDRMILVLSAWRFEWVCGIGRGIGWDLLIVYGLCARMYLHPTTLTSVCPLQPKGITSPDVKLSCLSS